jgi:hypothetical protein
VAPFQALGADPVTQQDPAVGQDVVEVAHRNVVRDGDLRRVKFRLGQMPSGVLEYAQQERRLERFPGKARCVEVSGDERTDEFYARAPDGGGPRLTEDVGTRPQPPEVRGGKIGHRVPGAQRYCRQLPDGVVGQRQCRHGNAEKVLPDAFAVEQRVRGGRVREGQVAGAEHGLPVALDDQAGAGQLHAEEDAGRVPVAGQPMGAFHLDGVRADRAYLELTDVGYCAPNARSGLLREVDVDLDDGTGNRLAHRVTSVRFWDAAGIEN